MSINQWFSNLLVSKRKGLKCFFFFLKAIFFQYFTVVEQFLLQFVKINKVNIKNTPASLLQIPLQGQILHSLSAFQLEIPFKSLHKHKQVKESSCSPTFHTPALRTLGMKHFVRRL